MLLLFITFFLGVRNIWQQKHRDFRLTAKIIKKKIKTFYKTKNKSNMINK